MFRRTLCACMVLAVCFALSSCTKKTPPVTRLALVADTGGFADRSFNAAASAGLTECERRSGIEVTRAAPASAADYETQLALVATQGFDTVIGVGAAMARDFEKVSRRFEGTRFAIVDAVVTEPNVESITFKEQEGSFLAGALAALVTRTKSVAFLGGADVARLEAAESGFTAGARAIAPHVKVRLRFAGSFTDAAAAAAAARALYSGGSDVVYVVAGKAGLGALAVAKERGAGYAIGVDSDQDGLAPGKVLASVVKRVDRATLRVCLETIAQKPLSGHVELGLADGGLELTPFTYTRAVVGAANIRRLQGLRGDIEAGRLVPPVTLRGLGVRREKAP